MRFVEKYEEIYKNFVYCKSGLTNVDWFKEVFDTLNNLQVVLKTAKDIVMIVLWHYVYVINQMFYVIKFLEYNMKAIIAHIKNIHWKAFQIVNILKGNFSKKYPAALLVRLLKIIHKRLYFNNAADLQKVVLIEI